jgi:hypothetical protein
MGVTNETKQNTNTQRASRLVSVLGGIEQEPLHCNLFNIAECVSWCYMLMHGCTTNPELHPGRDALHTALKHATV